MLSRMAASLYWIGRYVERAEQTARLTEVTFSHTLAMGSTSEAEARRERHWTALLEIVGAVSTFPREDGPPGESNVPAHLIFSHDNANSIVECIALARDNARTMRHQVATEMWEALNRFHLEVQQPARRRRATAEAEKATRFCRSVVDFSQLLQGITDSTMPREEGWYFLQAGKFLERAESTARTLDVNYRLLAGEGTVGGATDGLALDAAAEDIQPWATLLHSLSAYESYHRIQRRGIQPSAVIELLTLSPVLPRSIRFSVGQVEAALAHITEQAPAYNGSEPMPGWTLDSEARREVGRLHADFAYQRLEDLLAGGLHRALIDVQRRCYRIGDRIEDEFFAHRPLTAQEAMA
ncbi:MAG: alpha-E domain-containing protein [Actinobacteria bacterium]|nr:alpha-E domain-containing protein [Actinomycetota bacterium]